MKRKQIELAFQTLNQFLKEKGIKGEIGVVGGAAMVLAFNARAATKDVDAIFHPSQEIRLISKRVAAKLKLPEDWLNDAVKAYLPGEPKEKKIVLALDHLTVWVPPAQYLLAMKAISARLDSRDAEDLVLLCRHLKISKPSAVLEIVAQYYPRNQVPAKTTFFIEELFQKKK